MQSKYQVALSTAPRKMTAEMLDRVRVRVRVRVTLSLSLSLTLPNPS
jgi:hypothetical protein